MQKGGQGRDVLVNSPSSRFVGVLNAPDLDGCAVDLDRGGGDVRGDFHLLSHRRVCDIASANMAPLASRNMVFPPCYPVPVLLDRS